jgi:hypothetical protein
MSQLYCASHVLWLHKPLGPNEFYNKCAFQERGRKRKKKGGGEGGVSFYFLAQHKHKHKPEAGHVSGLQ